MYPSKLIFIMIITLAKCYPVILTKKFKRILKKIYSWIYFKIIKNVTANKIAKTQNNES